MSLVGDAEVSLEELAGYDVVLRRLREGDQLARAYSLAWAAIESVSERCSPKETLTVARPFLLAVEDSKELRERVVSLYGAAYGDRNGLDALIEEAGLGGGRPVRRAVRTLDVILSLSEGDFLAARDDDSAARVEGIDPEDWHVSITGTDGVEKLGPVQLADRFRRAEPNEFRIIRHFSPDELAKRLKTAPGEVVIDLCRENGGTIDNHALEEKLVPDLIAPDDWKKWWTRARTALKRFSNIEIEGRNPYIVTYVDAPIGLTDQLLVDFEKLHDPLAKLDRFTAYLTETKARGEKPCEDALRRCVKGLCDRAEYLAGNSAVQAGLWWVVARRIAELAGVEDGVPGAVAYFKNAPNLTNTLGAIERDELLNTACACVAEALDDWAERLGLLLPAFPLSVCEQTSARLLEDGWDRSKFESVVQAILESPVDHFEALLWLWDGPARVDQLPVPPLPALLSKILGALEECRRNDAIPRATTKRIGIRARAVLSARKYERFRRCLDELDPGFGRTFRARIDRLDSLGRSVAADLSSEIRHRFPPATVTVEAYPWELDDVLYCTSEGFARKQDDIDHHVNVTMKKNAKAIGDAAERGDLSENSEYKFALEERDLLRARLAQMNSELAAARVIVLEDVPTDHVGVGTKVVMKRIEDGEPYEISLVGPWEADIDKGWVNYKAPLASKILGLKIGDTVEFDHSAAKGTYEILALDNALAQAASS